MNGQHPHWSILRQVTDRLIRARIRTYTTTFNDTVQLIRPAAVFTFFEWQGKSQASAVIVEAAPRTQGIRLPRSDLSDDPISLFSLSHHPVKTHHIRPSS